MTLRIAMVVNNLNVGGLEKVVLSLLRGLDPNAFEAHLVCLDGPGRMFEEQPLPLERTLVLQKTPRKLGPIAVDPAALWKLRRWMLDRDIQLLHAHNLAPLVYSGLGARTAWRPERGRPRVVYSEHNQIYSATARTQSRFKNYIRLADHVVAVSRDLKGKLLAAPMSTRVPVDVIYNGIDGKRFSAMSGETVRRELGLAPGELLIGTGVVLSRQKAIENLVRAAPQVLKQAPQARFAVAGDGPLRHDLEALAHELGLDNRFRFLGYRSDMHQVIAALDVYVLPSLWEGLPLALLEAMAMNKLIVCTRVGGNPEIVTDGVNGLVVEPGDVEALASALVRALSDRALQVSASSHNRATFERQFSEPAMVVNHEQLYHQMLDRS